MNCEACGHENVDGARFCAKCGALMPVQEAEAEDAMIGQIVGGRYRVTGVLGEGGMGVVYIGEQQMGSTVRKVAIKTLHPHLSKDPSVLARFHRECGTVAQLEHPNTIKFYDFGSTADGTLYIAMEFVKGEPLMDVIEKGGPMAPDRVLKIMKQVCGALDEAHKQGIIHRDLKPGNLFIESRDDGGPLLKVLDYGIAKVLENRSTRGATRNMGTPMYMAPEQFGSERLTPRVDVYAVGMLAFTFLVGRQYFASEWTPNENPFVMADIIRRGPTEPASVRARRYGVSLPEGFDDWFRKATHPQPPQRFATADGAVMELTRLCLQRPRRAPLTPTLIDIPLRPPPGRSSSVPVALASVAIAVWLAILTVAGLALEGARQAGFASPEQLPLLPARVLPR